MSVALSLSFSFSPSPLLLQVIIYQGGQVFSLANHLNGRVGFVATMPSTSASIFINNTQLTDTGTYQCLVNNLPDRGGRNIGVIGLTVLGKPTLEAETNRQADRQTEIEDRKAHV